MKLRALVCCAASLTVSGCQTASVNAAAPELSKPDPVYSLTAAELSTVKAGVLRILKDPDSAKFGDIVATGRTDAAVTVCGTVNSKNSYGGYSGSEYFTQLMSRGNIIGSTNIGDYVANSYCAKLNLL